MKTTNPTLIRLIAVVASAQACAGFAQDWPQWRGPNRDAKVSGFQVPATWPEELTKKWQVTVGVGVATPALVGDKLFVFSRQDGNEVIRCLDAASGEEIWQDRYETEDTEGGASRYPGPRSSPTVVGGRVVTLGVRGVLSCLNASTGDVIWRKDEFQSWPMFFTASSPIVVDDLCIAELGGDRDGGIVAYDLATGEEKWKWTGDGPAYGSPVFMTVSGTAVIVTPTGRNLVALDLSNGELVWQIQYSEGRYNAATPIVDGQTLILAGLGTGMTAVQLQKQGDKLVSEKVWGNSDNSVRFNTPVLKDGLLVGLSNRDQLFCINTDDGRTVWSAPLGEQTAAEPPADGQRRGGGRGRGGRGGGGGGFGSVVDAGTVLLALSPNGQLVVFEASGDEFKQLASYQVAEEYANAYPVVSGRRIFVKDRDSIALWTIE